MTQTTLSSGIPTEVVEEVAELYFRKSSLLLEFASLDQILINTPSSFSLKMELFEINRRLILLSALYSGVQPTATIVSGGFLA